MVILEIWGLVLGRFVLDFGVLRWVEFVWGFGIFMWIWLVGGLGVLVFISLVLGSVLEFGV